MRLRSMPVLLSAVLAVSLLTGCPTMAPRAGSRVIRPKATEVYTHAASSFQFPPSVQGFDRGTVTEYDPSALNIGVGYNHPVLGIAATVYIYPIPQQGPDETLKGHFERCKADVFRGHAKAELLKEGTVQINPGGSTRAGEHAAFTYTESFTQAVQAVRSELYLFTHGRWFIKYRVTYPTSQQSVAAPTARLLIDELAWP
jgi:hypothetical protein